MATLGRFHTRNPAGISDSFNVNQNHMNPRNKIVVTALVLLLIGFLLPCHAVEMVTIDAKYKKDSVVAPEPEYPVKSRNMGYQGQGIYRLVVNDKTGIVDEVKVFKTTGHRELDASAVMALFNWKFRPGVKQRDVLVKFTVSGWTRSLH
jgi:TonB family protein